jgi:hypothetical protein
VRGVCSARVIASRPVAITSQRDPLSLYLILLPFFWGHIVGGIIYGLGWGAQVRVSMGSIFDVAEKTDHVTLPVHQHGQLPYDDASEEDDHQRQPCEIAHQNRNSLFTLLLCGA